jgi:hypothetical protein
MANASTTPWGAASVVDEVRVQQRAGEKRFASVVQLLETRGERLVRFSSRPRAWRGAARSPSVHATWNASARSSPSTPSWLQR